MTPLAYEAKVNREKLNFDAVLLGLYLFTLPLDFLPLFGGSVSKLVALLPVGFIFLFRLTRVRVHINVALVMALYVLLNHFSGTYALNYYVAEERTTALFLNLGLIIFCSSIDRNKREVSFLKKSLVMSGWFLLLIVFIYGEKMSGLRLVIKINGMRQDPNYFCGYMIFAILYYLDNILQRRKRAFSIVAFTAFLTVILLTGSRGGFLAVAIACFIFVLAQKTNKAIINRLVTIALAGTVLLFAANTFLPEEIKERYSLEFTKEDDGAGRFEIWKSLNRDYKYSNEFNKLFGKGAGNVRFYTSNGNVGHNLWLETRCELGIVGLILLIIIYMLYMKRAYRLKEKIYFSTLIGYITMTMSLSLCVYKPIYSMFLITSIVFDYEKNIKTADGESNNE